MGIGMAGNLSKVATSVVCFDPTPAAREAAESMGLKVASSAKAAVEDATAVVTMLPNGKIVSDLCVGGGMLFGCKDVDTCSFFSGWDSIEHLLDDAGTMCELSLCCKTRWQMEICFHTKVRHQARMPIIWHNLCDTIRLIIAALTKSPEPHVVLRGCADDLVVVLLDGLQTLMSIATVFQVIKTVSGFKRKIYTIVIIPLGRQGACNVNASICVCLPY